MQTSFLLAALPLIAAAMVVAFLTVQIYVVLSASAAVAIKQRDVNTTQALLVALPLYEGDLEGARNVLATILADQTFAGAQIVGLNGERLIEVGRPFGSDMTIRERRLTYANHDGIHALGTLRTAVWSDGVWGALKDGSKELAVLLVSVVAALILAVHLAYNRTVGRPLQRIVASLNGAEGERAINDLDRLDAAIVAYQRRETAMRDALEATNAQLERRVGELVEARDQVARLALTDALTELPNRRAFVEGLEAALAETHLGGVAIAILDLDNFKTVNDTLGHPIGDALLREIAQRLHDAAEGALTVARLGGDEFAVAWRVVGGRQEAGRLGQGILRALNRPTQIEGYLLHIGASIGLCLAPDDASDASAAMACADIALYRSKDAGRGRVSLFDEEMRSELVKADRVAADLRTALADDHIVPHYQPQYRLRDGAFVGLEVLARWRHPQTGFVPPNVFLPVAADRGLVLDVARALATRVAADVRRWTLDGLDTGQVAVNLHPRELLDPAHIAAQAETLLSSGLDASRFTFEITEDCLVGRGAQAARDVLNDLRARGFGLSLDDFGTGYASLAHINALPVTEIKIDRSFVTDLAAGDASSAITHAIAHIAQSLGLRTVAEGIETKEQAEAIRAIGDVVGQGYLFGRPENRVSTEAILPQIAPRLTGRDVA